MATSPNPRRSPGRPAANGGSDGQRDRLLDAALTCFVRDRIAATTARRIADEAGVTPALLNYYFGGRDGLLQAVLEERLMPVMQRVRAALDQAGDDPAALVSGFSRAIADAVTAHPWLPMLWVREVLLEGGVLREMLFERVGDLLPRVLAARFVAAQQAGRLNPDLDPRLLVVSLVGLTLFPAAAAPVWRDMFDAHDVDVLAVHEHNWRLLRDGLKLETTS